MWKWEYLYGLDYVHEVVLGWKELTVPIYYFQDANWNIVASADAEYPFVYTQHRYHPYGEMLAYEDAYDGDDIVEQGFDAKIYPVLHGHQGRYHDWETGLIPAVHRYYDPKLGRWISQDPHQTGLLVSQAMMMNAQTPAAFSNLEPRAQFTDGANLYQYVRSNPSRYVDPNGEVVHFVVAGLLGASFNALHKGIELFLSGQAANQDLVYDTIPQLLHAAGSGGIAGLKFMAAATVGGAGLTAALGGGLAANTAIAGGAFGVALGLKGLYEADQRSRYALDAQDELEMKMAMVDGAFGALTVLGGAIGIRAGFSVQTTRGPAIQSMSLEAISARAQVMQGARLWRIGTSNQSHVQGPQYWSLRPPRAPTARGDFGIPAENVASPDIVQSGSLKPNTNFITRTAPGGTQIEVVVPPGGVQLESVSVSGGG